MFLGGQPKNIQCLAQYVYSEKTQNAYYKTNLNYVHFDNDAEETFDIRNNGETTLIVVPYGEYEVYFSKQ